MPFETSPLHHWYESHKSYFQNNHSFEYVGVPQFGIHHLIHHHLVSLKSPVWFEITARLATDPILMANAFVEAFNRTAGERVLDHGIHPFDVVALIKKYTALFGEHTFVFCGTHHAPDFARSMLQLLEVGHALILVGEKRLTALPLITDEDLRLTRAEVFSLGEGFDW